MTESQDYEFREHLPFFILDVLRHDVIEPLSSILKMMNNDGCIGWRDCWPHDFRADEVVPVLKHLAQEGLVDVVVEDPTTGKLAPVPVDDLDFEKEVESVWFALTRKGKASWNQWSPPKEYP